MSLNLEKHINPKKKQRAPKREFVKHTSEVDRQRWQLEQLMQHPVSGSPPAPLSPPSLSLSAPHSHAHGPAGERGEDPRPAQGPTGPTPT